MRAVDRWAAWRRTRAHSLSAAIAPTPTRFALVPPGGEAGQASSISEKAKIAGKERQCALRCYMRTGISTLTHRACHDVALRVIDV